MVDFLYLTHIHNIQGITQNSDDGIVIFGKNFQQVARETRGQDNSAVRPPTLRDHIVEQVVIPRDTNDQSILRAVIKTMAEQVAFKLRKRQQTSKRVKLEIHYTDGLKSAHYHTDVVLNLLSRKGLHCLQLYD